MTATAAALRPVDGPACASALEEAARERRTLRVRGAGTKDHLGDLLPTELVLETTAMTGIVDHVPADLTVTVAAGTSLAALQRALAAAGQHLPLDPPHAGAATLGGIVAANSNGFGRLRYGGVRDLLIGSQVALADGTLARAGGRVVKNVAGYDLNKLLVGSLGTLGVLVEVTFRVLPLPASRAGAVARAKRAADAFAIADALLRTPLRPSALVVEHVPRSGWTVIVGASGERPVVERTLVETERAATASGASVERIDDPEPILAPLRELPASASDGALVRASLPLAAQRSFAESAVGVEGFARLVVDAGSGIARVHVRGEDAAVMRAADALVAAAHVVGGSAQIERRDPALRARLSAWGARPPGHFLMRRLKEAFDPAGILEPGRSAIG